MKMWISTYILTIAVISACVNGQNINPMSGNELVTTVLDNCVEMTCVKQHVLLYLDNLLNIQSDARNIKNIDTAIFKRAAKVLQSYEIKFKLPKAVFDEIEVNFNPKSGWDISSPVREESRVIGLKKKLLLPFLLLLKLKMKLLMPIFVAIIGLKAVKALILSKLAIAIVLGFLAYQLLGKAGMPMPLSMTPAPIEPASMYGVPNPSTAPPSSYEPGWEPNQGGPYQRVWSLSNSDPQNLAYSAYYQGTPSASSSTSRP